MADEDLAGTYNSAMQTVDRMMGHLDEWQGLELMQNLREMQARGENPLPGWNPPSPAQPVGITGPPTETAASQGLGLAQPSRSIGDVLAEEMFPGQPLNWLSRRALGQSMIDNPQALMQRETAAQRAMKMEQQRQEQQFKDFIEIDKQLGANPEQWDAQMQLMAARGNPHARIALQVGDKKLIGEFESLVPLINMYQPEFARKYAQDPRSVSKSEVRAVVDKVGKIKQQRALADADAQEEAVLDAAYDRYLKTGQGMNPGDAERLIELRNKREKSQLELEKLRLSNTKLQKETELAGSHVTQMAQELSQELFDKPWDQLNQSQRVAVEAMKERRLQARTSAVIQQGLPAPAEKRSNLIDRDAFMKHDRLQQPPPGTTIGGTATGNYVEMTDKQRDDWGNIVNSGATLQTLFDEVEPLVTARTPGQAAKQFAELHLGAVSKKNPKAATYLADSEAFSSRMARVFGSEVGVLTNPDVIRWQRALPTFGDTQQVLQEKKQIFMKIYQQTKQMYKKKIAGEDYSEDLVSLRRTLLKKADALSIPSLSTDEQFDILMGGQHGK